MFALLSRLNRRKEGGRRDDADTLVSRDGRPTNAGTKPHRSLDTRSMRRGAAEPTAAGVTQAAIAMLRLGQCQVKPYSQQCQTRAIPLVRKIGHGRASPLGWAPIDKSDELGKSLWPATNCFGGWSLPGSCSYFRSAFIIAWPLELASVSIAGRRGGGFCFRCGFWVWRALPASWFSPFIRRGSSGPACRCRIGSAGLELRWGY